MAPSRVLFTSRSLYGSASHWQLSSHRSLVSVSWGWFVCTGGSCDSICRGAVSNSRRWWRGSAKVSSGSDAARPSRRAQHTALRSLTEPDVCRGDRGQAWPSCALTLHGCPLTLRVGGPPGLSLTPPALSFIFCSSPLLQFSLHRSRSGRLTLSPAVIFSTYLFVSCCSFSSFATVIFGQQLS